METTFSIGTIAKVTGFSVDQLRIWERRYGRPKSLRLDSGHRRYDRNEIRRLMLVRQALDKGLRPNKVVRLDEKELMELLGQRQRPPMGSVSELASPMKEWIKAAQAMDDDTLQAEFAREWKNLGAPAFFIERALPFMKALGEGWQQGEVCVAEEHLGSESLGDFLTSLWRHFNKGNQGPAVVITTLPGNYHRNAILMIAVMTAMAGKKVVYLGPSTPIKEINIAVNRSRAEAVYISASILPGKESRALIQNLRSTLSGHVHLVAGGLADERAIDGVRGFEDMMDFYHWLHETRPMHAGAPAGFMEGL